MTKQLFRVGSLPSTLMSSKKSSKNQVDTPIGARQNRTKKNSNEIT